MTGRPSRRAVGVDIGVAAVFAVLAFVEAAGHGDNAFRGTAPPLVGGLVAAIAPVPLALRRVRPIGCVIAVASLAFLPHLLVSYDAVFIGGLLAVTVALASAAQYGARPLNRLALLPPLAGLVLFSLLIRDFAGQAAAYAVILLSGWTLGILVRALVERRGALQGALDARAAAEALRLEHAITEERKRVARDLHDVIAHCVSVMVLQAGAARLRLPFDPASSATAIEQIETTGREALIELERVLGLLRADPLDDPSASLTHIDRLADQVGAAGLRVSVQVDGDPSTLSPALDRSLYRVAQEGLTNALKHGLDAQAELRITVDRDRVAMAVWNPAGPHRVPRLPGGNGQTGMRERVAAFGGALTTRLEAGSYELRAEVPLQAVER